MRTVRKYFKAWPANHEGIEARLAGALANGYSLEKIAETFRLSRNTVRTQLKSCFQKTGGTGRLSL
ncbi:helix-turn-helix transcriptional regulator [Marinobacter santoriniensis]|uniref:helix-turn-helix transcriptional regulator n=1 Tax=Marinobacter santoriniensis TaxID=523742 RepID=UPI000347B870